MQSSECHLYRQILFVSGDFVPDGSQRYILDNFFGVITHSKEELLRAIAQQRRAHVYCIGNLSNCSFLFDLETTTVLIVHELSTQYEELIAANRNVKLTVNGKVPINVHNVGVMFRCFFDTQRNYFGEIQSKHSFQSLTESNKPGTAFRKGIYLTNVEKNRGDGGQQNGDVLSFHLLRCSTNLQGPTDNFSDVDREILHDANTVVEQCFDHPGELNHVLAQIYFNTRNETSNKETKAKISRHSDKTKDMPSNGLLAFVSFYDFANVTNVSSETDEFDLVYHKKTSILTQLEFVLKDPQKHPHLEKQFRVTLYPNSLFVISLETNRLYTHEIKPSSLPIEHIPTRMGYVIRCSNRKAVFRNGQTYILDENNVEKPLQNINSEVASIIKERYMLENLTDSVISYPLIQSSLNSGDYLMPRNASEPVNHCD